LKFLVNKLTWSTAHNNAGQLRHVPFPILKWLVRMELDHLVTWCEGDLFPVPGYKRRPFIYMCLMTGLRLRWTLSGRIISFRKNVGKINFEDEKTDAIELTEKEFERMVRQRTDLALEQVDRRTVKNFTEES